jgi:hypothetical protein
VIRIDVHPAGENPTNTTCTLPTSVHVCPTYTSCGRSPYVATFHTVINKFEQIHCTWEEGLPTQSTARGTSDPRVRTQVLSNNSQWSSGEKSSFCWQPTTRLIGSILPVCDRYVQYLLTGTNHPILNRHRRGYHIENLGIATTLSPPFPSEGSTDPPKWPRPVSNFYPH